MATMLRRTTEQLLSQNAIKEAQQVSRALSLATGVQIMTPDGVTQLGPELMGALGRMVTSLAAGRAVTVGAMPEEITTTTAAEILGVSRPTVMKMIADGELSAHKVGTHSRLKTSDVLEALKKKRAVQRAAIEELRDLEDELGL